MRAFGETNPDVAKKIIRCGIGDVTEPLPAAATAAMHKAVDEMGTRDGFHGYGPEQELRVVAPVPSGSMTLSQQKRSKSRTMKFS